MLTEEEVKGRFIPFNSLTYSTEAFIDYRIPASSPKYNYALIGSGVSQNPKQPISLREQHGFQIGGISMPHGKTNPPHLHFTAEVFICSRGDWEMQWGFNPGHESATIGVGDLLTVPTWIYRGFKNVGVDDGFMFTALGRDSTGGILWGPATLDAARDQGVHLTEDYRIVDEQAGDQWDDALHRLQPMTDDEIAALRCWSPEEMGRRIVRFDDLQWSADALLDATLPGCGALLAPAIGLGMSEDRNHAAPVAASHGFSIEWLRLPPGGRVSEHQLDDKQVLIVFRGELTLRIDGTDVVAKGAEQAWDTVSVPEHSRRSLRNQGAVEVVVLVVGAGDGRNHIRWATEVVSAAGLADRAIDANGYVGRKHHIDRAQT